MPLHCGWWTKNLKLWWGTTSERKIDSEDFDEEGQRRLVLHGWNMEHGYLTGEGEFPNATLQFLVGQRGSCGKDDSAYLVLNRR